MSIHLQIDNIKNCDASFKKGKTLLKFRDVSFEKGLMFFEKGFGLLILKIGA